MDFLFFYVERNKEIGLATITTNQPPTVQDILNEIPNIHAFEFLAVRPTYSRNWTDIVKTVPDTKN